MANFSLSIINKIEKKIREATNFQYIASDESEGIIDALRQMSVRSGLAIYIWLPGSGLVNIKSKQAPLPSTRSVLEALKYAAKNHYFAVYVFPAIHAKDLLEMKSTLPSANLFLKINENTRLLFLIEESVNFNFLETRAEEIVLRNRNARKYKLRDGQWVLSDG